jgi:hypothetical protein
MPIAGNALEVTSLIDGVSMVGTGIVYLPAECTQPGEFGDLYVTIPAGRDWTSREHGGTDTYVVRQLTDEGLGVLQKCSAFRLTSTFLRQRVQFRSRTLRSTIWTC